MRIAGTWVGWGLGDHSQTDDTVRRAKRYMRAMFASYAGHLADTNVFDVEMENAVKEMQRRLVEKPMNQHRLLPGQYIVGVLDLPTQYAMGFKQPPAPAPPKRRPVIITVEGHMSNMWVGPCAAIAQQLEKEQLAWHQPIGYDSTRLPFNNKSGVDGVLSILHSDEIGPPDDRRPFDDGVDVYMLGHSQGAIIVNQVWLNHLRRASGGSKLARRRDRLQRVVVFGDPYREKDADAGWWPDPPKPGTQGISDVRMVDTPPWWKTANRTGDLYTENEDNEVGLYKTSIYKIVSENQWWGGPAGMLARLMDLATPLDDVIPIIKAIMGGIMFVGNMDPHALYNLDAPTDYIRRGLKGEPRPT